MSNLKPGTCVVCHNNPNRLNGKHGTVAGPERPVLGVPVDFDELPCGSYCSPESLEPERRHPD